MQTGKNLKDDIFKLVKQFYVEKKEQESLVKKQTINYAGRVYDENEMINAVDSILDFTLTYGKYIDLFESKFSKYINCRYSHFVNSGSSANLLAFMTLTSKQLGEGRIKRGDEVITTACCFPTTVTPIINYGAIPVFIDCDINGNILVDNIEEAITDKTKAVMITHTLGNPFNVERVKQICTKYNLWLVEDCCFTARTIIPTKDGNKYISDVKVGDKVLGFDGISFKETIVQEIGNRLVPKEEMLVLKLDNSISVRCTKDHLFYIKGNWVKAQDIKVGDEIYHCNFSEYVLWRREYNLSDKGRKSLSDKMKKNNPSFDPENIKKGYKNRFHKKTHIEKQVIRTIEHFGLPIEYVGNGKLWIGSKKDGYKNPDFIFKDKNILYEVYDPTFKYANGFRDFVWEKERYEYFKKYGYHTEFLSLKGWVNKEQRNELGKFLRKTISNGIKVLEIKKLRNAKSVNLQEEFKNMVRVYNIKCVPLNNFCIQGGILVHNCDSLGSTYNGKHVGTFGDLATCSFYPAHHITVGNGGMVFTNSPLLSKIAKSMRDWGRDCICKSGEDNKCGKRFDKKFGNLPKGFDHKYVYSEFGMNLAATEMQAAIGVAQLDKIEQIVIDRKNNYKKYLDYIYCKDYLYISKSINEFSDPSWFGILMNVRKPYKRKFLVKHLEDSGIQTRMLFSGNIIKHPCFESLEEDKDYKIIGKLNNTNNILENSFWLGTYSGLTNDNIEFICNTINNFFKGKTNE
jgi:dTDP-4-amino-4,6-dideoxygalactose transaminase